MDVALFLKTENSYNVRDQKGPSIQKTNTVQVEIGKGILKMLIQGIKGAYRFHNASIW